MYEKLRPILKIRENESYYNYPDDYEESFDEYDQA